VLKVQNVDATDRSADGRSRRGEHAR
jgi:hypothetical protein